MSNLNETCQEMIDNAMSIEYPNGPIGNKLVDIVEGKPLVGEIDRVMAESFIKKASSGMIPELAKHKINFNEGIYKFDFLLLKNIYKLMKEINAEYLTFTFVEINSDNDKLDLKQGTNGNVLYTIASLQKKENITIDGHNYLILNAKKGQVLEDLKVTYMDRKNYQALYCNNSHKVLKEYFSINGLNTQYIYYNIEDLRKTLEKEEQKCKEFKVYLCEISDVVKVIADHNSSLKIEEKIYHEHFEGREGQMTLVFFSGSEYYDMGGLRP